jgi:alpha-L-arabinofuranosidase
MSSLFRPALRTLSVIVVTLGSFLCAASTAMAAVSLSASRVAFYAKSDGSTPPSQLFKVITLTNSDTHPVNWVILTSDPWIFVPTVQGALPGNGTATIPVAVDITKAVVGAQTGSVAIWDTDAIQLIATVTVFLRVCDGICVSVDMATAVNTVSPLLFGSQIDWLNSGNYLWSTPVSTTCTATGLTGGFPKATTIAQVRNLGVRLLRYPSGIPADYFHWAQAVGPVGSRSPQVDPWNSNSLVQARQCPVFGPDEFVSVATQLGTQIMTTTNAGTGTAPEAASWLAYYTAHGVPARYWEVGNEIYIPGYPVGDPNGFPYVFAGAYMASDKYAMAYDAYAKALRAIDPTIKLGAAAAINDTTWNIGAYSQIHERVDFVSVHTLFPLKCTTLNSPDETYRMLLAAPTFMTIQLEQLKQTLASVATPQNSTPDLAITEHGAFFWCLDYARNNTLASALFSALSFNVFFREPRITMANHSNLDHSTFQAPLTPNIFGADVQTALYPVFRLYAQTAGGTVTSTSVLGAPTFSTDGLGVYPPQSGVPVLDSVAVRTSDSRTLRVFVVNRSLTNDVTARVALDAFPGTIGSITVAIVNGPTYDAANSVFAPNTVSMMTMTVAAAAELSMLFPAHSLVMLAVQAQ